MDIGALKPADRQRRGRGRDMLGATGNYKQPLTSERLFGWHAGAVSDGRSGMRKIRTGAWRDDSEGPMQVVFRVPGKGARSL